MEKLLKKLSDNIPIDITDNKFHDAIRLAVQSAISAAITFLIMKYAGLPEMFLSLLSAVLVVEPSIGNTFDRAKNRVLATIVGSAIGFIFVSIIPWGYGIVASLVISMLFMKFIATYKPSWSYGVVAAVAISLGSENNALETSLDRLIAIGIGISVGILVTATVWPEKAKQRARGFIRKALEKAKERFKVAYKNNKVDETSDSEDIADNFHTYLGKAKDVALSIRLGDKQKVLDQIDATEKLYNSALILHRVGLDVGGDTLTDNAGIDSDSRKINDTVHDMIESIVNKESIKDEQMHELEGLNEKIIREVNTEQDNKERNMIRYAFVYGITEIKESMKILREVT